MFDAPLLNTIQDPFTGLHTLSKLTTHHPVFFGKQNHLVFLLYVRPIWMLCSTAGAHQKVSRAADQ